MFATLKSKKHSSITLGKLRQFINNDCRSLSDNTLIAICDCNIVNLNTLCTAVIADDESITFYNK